MRTDAHFGVLTSKRCADANVRCRISPLQQFEIGVSGPLPTLGLGDHAAAQHHRSGRSHVAQHLLGAKLR